MTKGKMVLELLIYCEAQARVRQGSARVALKAKGLKA